jgi:non-ribosomal peptide synthetase component F
MGAMNVGRMLETTAELPEHPAVCWGDRVLTYSEFDGARTPWRTVASLGVQRGDRVAVLMRNRPESSRPCTQLQGGLLPRAAQQPVTAAEVAIASATPPRPQS